MKKGGRKPFEITEALRIAWYAQVDAIRQARVKRVAASAGINPLPARPQSRRI